MFRRILTQSFVTFTVLLGFAFSAATEATAQQFSGTDIQIHYNFGKQIYKNTPYVYGPSLAFEHYGTDKYGETLVYVDAALSKTGIGESKWVIARDLRFWDAPIALHGGYTGGFTTLSSRPIKSHTYTAGIDYVYQNKGKDLKLNFIAAYRHEYKMVKPHGLQVSAYWQWQSWNRLWTLKGYLSGFTTSIFGDQMTFGCEAEPQFWLNINQFVGVNEALDFSVGTTAKLSYNVLMPEKFLAMPTLAVKFNF